MARPEVDVLEGLTTAIIVDQERMGANSRSTVGTATDASAMLRVLFSRLGKPHIGSSNAFSFNIPTRRASGSMTTEKGERTEKKIVRDVVYQGGMCARCEGMGHVNDINVKALYDEDKSLAEGAIKVPGYNAEGWHTRMFAAAGLDPDKPIKKYSKKELQNLLYNEPMKVKVEKINLTYEGIVPRIRKAFLSKDVDALQPHIRAFVERVATFTTCPDCKGTRLNEAARSSKINGRNIADVCAMQISDLAQWLADLGSDAISSTDSKANRV
jgi:excinuclease UvrABC ATPase subunit